MAIRTSRRALIAGAAGVAGVAGLGGAGVTPLAWAKAGGSQTLSLRPSAFVIDGKPVFLTFGSVDYFRCPRELWRDRLLRAKRAGVNAIAFYVAWNFHEREDGVFTFEGDADLGAFIDTCQALGLYAFPRVGPFICAEWEGGGHPAWLTTKPGIELRTQNEATLFYVRRWFGALMGVLAPRQVTRGGPIVMVQQENEYFFVGRERVRDYQASLVLFLREFGIEVPISDCNGARAETRIPGSMATLNGGGSENIRTLRKLQPDKPAVISELYTDYITMWGWPVNSYPTTGHVLHQAMDTLAEGGMIAWFMFHGGTNFGYWASTSWKSDQSFVTTRYYSRGPIAEGGAFNPTYYAAKSVSLLASNLGAFLAEGAPGPAPVAVAGPVQARAILGPRGALVFVLPEQPEAVAMVYHTDNSGGPLIQLGEDWPMPEIASAAGVLRLGSGRDVELAEPSSTPVVLPWRLEVDPGLRIDYANATLLGLAGDRARRVIVLRGGAGRRGVIAINGQEAEFVFGEEPVQIPVAGALVLAVSTTLADRTWFAEGRVLIGPTYVGEAQGDRHVCFLDGSGGVITAVSRRGTVTRRETPRQAAASAHVPLTDWISSPLPEIAGGGEGWRALAAPAPVETFKAYAGYTWYGARIRSETARRTGLVFTAASDRLTVFVNGARMGVWGRGEGGERDALPIDLEAGENALVFLCDNMGRRSEGAEQDRKGIVGPAYIDGAPRPVPVPVLSGPAAPVTQSWRWQTYRHYYPDAPLQRATYTVTPRPGEGLMLSLRWFPHYAWISVDGQVIAEHPGDLALADGTAFSSHVLDPYLKGRPVRIELAYAGGPVGDLSRHVGLISYPKAGALGDWRFREWRDPLQTGPARAGQPTWWTCTFDRPSAPGPLFLATKGLRKGHAYLNGRALGRYWEIGPQHALYMPEPWFAARNTLVIFDEEGARPDQTYILRDARAPTHSLVF